ncbi:hypothetical protein [Dickeya oryzae]|uniref:Uncharacterized protein n=1 Tax=Dickeya oryzae TaxID=1240404 RepID=A0AB39I9A6_9GAMM|nr:hypothetical protein [Dickeya oryzae]MCA6993911.1 hypothetical protein [Dickeya oryzae]
MSYARRIATKRTPAMQAALDKRASMMLHVHQARVSGELVDATIDSVKPTQSVNVFVVGTTPPKENNYAPGNEINALDYVWSKVNCLETPNPDSAAFTAMMKSHEIRMFLEVADRISREGCSPGIAQNVKLLKFQSIHSAQIDEDDDGSPRPLSTSTIPAEYFFSNKSGR